MRFGMMDIMYMVMAIWEAMLSFLYIVQMSLGNIGAGKALIILLILALVMYWTLWCIFCKEEYNRFVECEGEDDEDEDEE